jgi:hypothetical protein
LNVEIDTASVNSSDTQRDEHLGNGDFVDVPQFPTIHFQSILGKSEGDIALVTDDLTILGATVRGRHHTYWRLSDYIVAALQQCLRDAGSNALRGAGNDHAFRLGAHALSCATLAPSLTR